MGTALTIALAEYLRLVFVLKLVGMAETIYCLLLRVFIIFLLSGIYGNACCVGGGPSRPLRMSPRRA